MKLYTPVICLLSLLYSTAYAALPYQSDSILISTSNTLYEYSTDGDFRSESPIPPNATGEQSRDLIVMSNEAVAVFNGTFNPDLSIFDGTTWSHTSIAGWSTPNNGSFGGITSTGNRVFLSDGYTYGGEPKGIVVYDRITGSSMRIMEANDYIDLSIGLDGKLYALRNTYGALDIIDPSSLEHLSSVALGHTSSSRGVTADSAGNIYMVSWSNYVAKYSSTGELLTTLQLGPDPFDIDINTDGTIIVSGRFGDVYLTDTSLTSFSHFTVGSTLAFVAFASREDIIPAPDVTASSVMERARYNTTLNWSTAANGVDVYLNDTIIDSFAGSTGSVTYTIHKKETQVFKVCNTGTALCSATYTPY